MIKKGDKVTADHDVIDISGNIILEKDKEYIARKLTIRKGFWGWSSGMWYPDQLLDISIEGHYGGTFLPQVFKETKYL